MKKLIAGLLLVCSTALAAPKEYTVEIDKDTIRVKEQKGAVITLPRSAVAVVKEGDKKIYVMISLINDAPVALAIMDDMCTAGVGKIGVLDVNLNQLMALVDFDFKQPEKSPAFVAEYMCSLGKGKLKPTSTKSVQGKNYI